MKRKKKFLIIIITTILFLTALIFFVLYRFSYFDSLKKSTLSRVEWNCEEIDLSFFTWNNINIFYSDEEFIYNNASYEIDVKFEDLNSNEKKLVITGTPIDKYDSESIEIKGVYKCNSVFGYGIELKLDKKFKGYDKLNFIGKEIGF